MIEPTPTVSALEASVILYRHFGELRAWPDFLTDCIRSRQDIGGFTLMPCARKRGQRGLQTRYAVAGLKAFITSVKATIPTALPSPMKAVTLAIDTDKPWRLNQFERDGGKAFSRVFAGAVTI
jgi:hypothetical protein